MKYREKYIISPVEEKLNSVCASPMRRPLNNKDIHARGDISQFWGRISRQGINDVEEKDREGARVGSVYTDVYQFYCTIIDKNPVFTCARWTL